MVVFSTDLEQAACVQTSALPSAPKAMPLSSRPSTYITHIDKKEPMDLPSQHREPANDPLPKMVQELHGVFDLVDKTAT
jgi:hypothetical protein